MNDSPSPVRKLFGRDRVLLFVLSFLSLYIEIMLIRHVSSEIRIFAYFKNLTLVGAFLGLGTGYLYKPKLGMSVTLGAIAFIAFATHPVMGFGSISEHLSFGDFNIWAAASLDVINFVLGLLMLSVVFFAILASMVPIGQRLAEIFDRSENRIVDYSINIFASISGIWFFAWLSFSMYAPIVWYAICLAIMLAVWRWNSKINILILVLAMVSIISLYRGGDLAQGIAKWSPYQKITFKRHVINYDAKGEVKSIPFHSIHANNTFYLFLLDLSFAMKRNHSTVFPEKYDRYLYYDIPYNFPKKIDDVLILGAGGGNDVAGALRAGAKNITAVEIDPLIISLGKGYHPEKPYDAKNVTLINNDARNYLLETDKKFDLIVTALLDSHTLTSNFSNTSLDSFMYTEESIGDMKKSLNDDGVLILSFQVSHIWIGAKIYHLLENVFNRPPLVLNVHTNQKNISGSFVRGTGGTYFIISNNATLLAERVEKDQYLKRWETLSKELRKAFQFVKPDIPTDDWPYLYAKSKTIPTLHLVVTLLLISIFLLVYRRFFGKPTAPDLHFAALGAGFLLLEVSVISRFALFWGTTWLISSIVISLILMAILIANGLFIKWNRAVPYPLLYGALLISLLAVYFTPLQSSWVVALYLVPFTIIGYLFAQSFAGTRIGSRALGYNLFGALLGGLSESMSFVYGLSGLILIAIGFYAISFIFARKGL